MPTAAKVRPGARVSDYPAGERVTVLVARRLRVKESTAHQLLYGRDRISLRAAAILDVLHRCGDRGALAHFLAPILAAQRGLFTAMPTSTMPMQVQTADVDEELSEKAYDLNQCHATAEQFVRAIDLEILLKLEQRQALVNQWGLPC